MGEDYAIDGNHIGLATRGQKRKIKRRREYDVPSKENGHCKDVNARKKEHCTSAFFSGTEGPAGREEGSRNHIESNVSGYHA